MLLLLYNQWDLAANHPGVYDVLLSTSRCQKSRNNDKKWSLLECHFLHIKIIFTRLLPYLQERSIWHQRRFEKRMSKMTSTNGQTFALYIGPRGQFESLVFTMGLCRSGHPVSASLSNHGYSPAKIQLLGCYQTISKYNKIKLQKYRENIYKQNKNTRKILKTIGCHSEMEKH